MEKRTKRYWFAVPDDAEHEIVVQSLAKELGIKIVPLKGGARYSNGPGFGDRVWRVNYERNRIEASFAKPCDMAKSLEAQGFRWVKHEGIWCAPNVQYFADLCTKLGMEQAEGVPRS